MNPETQMLQPESETNRIDVEPEFKKFVKSDLEIARKEGTIILEIKFDVFKSKLNIEDIVKLASNILSKEDVKKIRESADESRKIWFECFAKAKGDLRKARELYRNY